MVAGQKIYYIPNTVVHSGGYLSGFISPGSPYCLDPAMPSVLKEQVALVQESPEKAFIKIYPNPTSGNFTLQLSGDSQNAIAKVQVYDLTGLQIFETEIRSAISLEISLINHCPGIYLVKMIWDNQIFTGKVIRQ
jgi:hypothetical protein